MTRRLVRLCVHDQIKPHRIGEFFKLGDCPGGEFLPEDALVIEKVKGEWPEVAHLIARRWKATGDGTHHLFDALADQVGEPG